MLSHFHSGFSVHGSFQAKILEWAAIPALQVDLPDPEIKPWPPILQADSLQSKSPGKPLESNIKYSMSLNNLTVMAKPTTFTVTFSSLLNV